MIRVESEETKDYVKEVKSIEGDEAYTTNLCQRCFNKHLQAKGEMPLTNMQWR